MPGVSETRVPEGSLLARYGGPDDYRDCFCREVPHPEGHAITLPDFIERFYRSAAFLPERMILSVIAGPSSSADARAFARGETDRFGAWQLVERNESEALFLSKDTNTASWFCVQPGERTTRLLFGSWVGGINKSGWRAMLYAHVWYSRVLLGAV